MTLRILLALMLYCAVALPAVGQSRNVPATLDSAATAYSEARYNESLELYLSCLDDGVEDARLYYNIGNAYFKAGRLGKSILFYERAYLLEPGDEEIHHNLQVARARIRDRVDPIPLLFVVQWWNDLKTGHSFATLFTWSVILGWLLAVFVFVFFGMRNVFLRRAALAGGILVAALFVASAVLVQDKGQDLRSQRFGIVMPVEVSVSSAPDRSGVDAFLIHEGLKVEVQDQQDERLFIRLADGKEGWIDAQAIERI